MSIHRSTCPGESPSRHTVSGGFAPIDLLVVLASIGLMVSLALPALQVSRDTARQTQCADNLRQLGEACRRHEAAVGHLPTNGWAPFWIGDPTRGANAMQPGGWIFNILPYMGQQALYDLQTKPTDTKAQQTAATTLIQTPLAILNCPSRRSAVTYPVTDPPNGALYFIPGGILPRGIPEARADYAGNGGSVYTNILDAELFRNISEVNTKTIDSLFSSGKAEAGAAKLYAKATGVFFPASQITMAEISDGASVTYLCGEKYLQTDHYLDGKGYGDQWGMYTGDGIETTRWGGPSCPPARDNCEESLERSFGSAHPKGFNMCFCDGSVRVIAYDIDLTVHERLANRKDGKEVGVDFRHPDSTTDSP